MVLFDALSVSNFKRYAGSHRIPLAPVDGTLAIVAAQNGVGKTSLLDAIHIALWGKRGFQVRHSGPKAVRFNEWLHQSYAVAADEEFPHLRFAIDLRCPINGAVRVERVYWLVDGEVDEEFGVTVEGTPVEVAPGERRADVAGRWVEALVPLATMRRFLVDCERLEELDPRHVDQEMRAGLDDILGLEVLHRLRGHLNTLSSRADTSKEEAALATRLTAVRATKRDLAAQLEQGRLNVERLRHDEANLREAVVDHTEHLRMASEGASASSARVAFAEAQAHMAAARLQLAERVADVLPFLLMGLPDDVDVEWGMDRQERSLNARAAMSDFLPRLSIVKERAGLNKNDDAWADLDRAAREVLDEQGAALDAEPRFEGFDLDALSAVRGRLAQLDLAYARSDVVHVVEQAKERLSALQRARGLLSKASEGRDISAMIDLVESTSAALGRIQEELETAEADLDRVQDLVSEVEGEEEDLMEALTGLEGEGAVALMLQLSTAIDHLIHLHHAQVGGPLANGFETAFKALSRKSSEVEAVEVEPVSYNVAIAMEGFNGNWLDYDISATERQHVGLALTSALRGLSTRALPVVVDTPTSRMDREHKTWSIQRFYPSLSHQTIILATSDDLADGLYEELASTGAIGRAVEVRELDDGSIRVVEADLATFFGGA